MKFIVFGLGRFGSTLSQRLIALGHEVVGIDSRLDAVERSKNTITHAICIDTTKREALGVVPLPGADAVVVSIGEDEGASIMTVALLKQMGVKRIISRTTSPLQRTVIEAMGVEEFVYPEAESAERLAYKLDRKEIVDSFRISDNYSILEVTLPQRYIGERVGDLDLVNRYRVTIVTVLRATEKGFSLFGREQSPRKALGVVSADTVLRKDDILVLFGDVNDIERFIDR
jgi:trk system potassium uptake protein TrkA